MIVDVSKSSVILSSAPVIKLLKSKEASNVIDIKVIFTILANFPCYKSQEDYNILFIAIKPDGHMHYLYICAVF